MDIGSLIPQFGNTIFTIIAFIIALSIIVAVHEFGHYIVGRWSGIKADVFSVGFGKVLWARTDKHGTQWQVAALPLGGYVRFKGDANAASAGADDEAMAALAPEELRETMHGAPLWARAATVLAGPVFNFILTFIIFAIMAMVIGIATKPVGIGSLYPLPEAGYEIAVGDKIVAIEGTAMPEEDGGDFFDNLPRQQALEYTVLRDGSELDVMGPPIFPTRVGYVTPGSPADLAGVLEGDVITALNGAPMTVFSQLIEKVTETQGAPLDVSIWRDGQMLELNVTPEKQDIPTADNSFETRYLMGVSSAMFFEPEVETPGVWEAMKIGANRTWGLVELTFSGIYHMVTGAISSCNISGPIGMAKISGEAASQGFASFVSFVALLSTAVGLLNLFPIPVLDGGHLVFHAYEALAGKPPSDGALRILFAIGLALMATLMIFALFNDLFC